MLITRWLICVPNVTNNGEREIETIMTKDKCQITCQVVYAKQIARRLQDVYNYY